MRFLLGVIVSISLLFGATVGYFYAAVSLEFVLKYLPISIQAETFVMLYFILVGLCALLFGLPAIYLTVRLKRTGFLSS